MKAKNQESSVAIAPVAEQPVAIALNQTEVTEMFGESKLDTATRLSFNVMKISRETAQFELAGDFYKMVSGNVLFKHMANQWWETRFEDRKEGESVMPNCYSVDAVKPCGGDKMQSEFCATCPQNKFGSGKDGSGKACRNTVRFLFLPDGAVLPVVLSIPPTSLSKKGSLQTWLNDVPNKVATAYNALNIHTKKGGAIVDYWPATVELTLAKEKFQSGMEASVLKVKTLDVLTPNNVENANKLRQLFSMVKDATEAYRNEMTAYVESESAAETVDTSEPGDYVDPTDEAAEIPI
jgi:hypothetical protein